jgi:hypothetical protein
MIQKCTVPGKDKTQSLSSREVYMEDIMVMDEACLSKELHSCFNDCLSYYD